MAVLKREDFFSRLNDRLGSDTSEEGITFLEDMTIRSTTLRNVLTVTVSTGKRSTISLMPTGERSISTDFSAAGALISLILPTTKTMRKKLRI